MGRRADRLQHPRELPARIASTVPCGLRRRARLVDHDHHLCRTPRRSHRLALDPEKYDLLRARMGGWTEFFVTMFPAHQAQHQRRPIRNRPNRRHDRECGSWQTSRRVPPVAHLVESIPVGLEDLRGTPGVQYTEDVLVRLTGSAQYTIDLTAMYWALLPDPDERRRDGLHAGAARRHGRGRRSRPLRRTPRCCRAWCDDSHPASPGFVRVPTEAARQESDTLREEFPDRVDIHSIAMGDWYGGGGIMHQKIWVFDGAPRLHRLGQHGLEVDHRRSRRWVSPSRTARPGRRRPAVTSNRGGASAPLTPAASKCSTPSRASTAACRAGRRWCRSHNARHRRWEASIDDVRPREPTHARTERRDSAARS